MACRNRSQHPSSEPRFRHSLVTCDCQSSPDCQSQWHQPFQVQRPCPTQRLEIYSEFTQHKEEQAKPLPPEMMAPACPIRLPGGAVRPAMKLTTGFGWLRVLLYCSRYSAASSSIEPPISPIKTMPAHKKSIQIPLGTSVQDLPSVLGSSRKILTTSKCCVPGNGSPPMPTQRDWPIPASEICATASYDNVPERETTPTMHT
jgi:hypothetical protein